MILKPPMGYDNKIFCKFESHRSTPKKILTKQFEFKTFKTLTHS